MKTVTFTGSRPNKIYGYMDNKGYENLRNVIFELLQSLYDQGFRRFITGGAQGFDQLVLSQVIELKKIHPEIVNELHRPFEKQDSAWLNSGLFSPENYRKLISQCDVIRDIAPEKNIDTSTKYGIGKALHARNHTMIAESDLLVGLHEHNMGFLMESGGTAEALRHAWNNTEIEIELLALSDLTTARIPRFK